MLPIWVFGAQVFQSNGKVYEQKIGAHTWFTIKRYGTCPFWRQQLHIILWILLGQHDDTNPSTYTVQRKVCRESAYALLTCSNLNCRIGIPNLHPTTYKMRLVERLAMQILFHNFCFQSICHHCLGLLCVRFASGECFFPGGLLFLVEVPCRSRLSRFSVSNKTHCFMID